MRPNLNIRFITSSVNFREQTFENLDNSLTIIRKIQNCQQCRHVSSKQSSLIIHTGKPSCCHKDAYKTFPIFNIRLKNSKKEIPKECPLRHGAKY
jgi:hypothetical protein